MNNFLLRYFGKAWMALTFLFLYLPLMFMIVFSFNSTRQDAQFTGFSLRWYEALTKDTSAPGLSEDPKVYSIVPLAFPVIAGSGTITTVLSLRAEFTRPEILVAIILNMVVVVTVLLLTNRIERMLGRVGLIVLRKAFGVILLAISVKLFAGNITYLFPG